jgi:hypothetical protein
MPDQLTDILNSADAAEALAKVAAVAVHVRTKQAIPAWAKSVGDTVSDYAGKGVDYAKQVGESAPDWAKSLGGTVADTAKQVWDNPHGRTALVGGGLSAAAGGLASLTDPRKRKRWLSNTLGAGLAEAAEPPVTAPGQSRFDEARETVRYEAQTATDATQGMHLSYDALKRDLSGLMSDLTDFKQTRAGLESRLQT